MKFIDRCPNDSLDNFSLGFYYKMIYKYTHAFHDILTF